ncbi:MAG: hypothetical protein GX796_04275 [Clostridiaceae bacterium]|nr:hypothetical protein [Clostridiaceae bacterium]
MDKSKTTRIVVNTETGEIEHELQKGDRIVRKNSVESLIKKQRKDKDTEQRVTLEWNLENFFKVHVPEMRLWMKDLSQTERAFLFSITTYVSYEDCHLQYDNGADIDSEDLVAITGLSRSVVYQTINSLVNKDILYKGRNSVNRQYFANPWLFCKGNRVNKVLKTMFKNYRIRVLNNKRWKDLKE